MSLWRQIKVSTAPLSGRGAFYRTQGASKIKVSIFNTGELFRWANDGIWEGEDR